MLKRLMFKDLYTWHKSSDHHAFLISGARQVGKTTLVREFAKANDIYLAEINFYEKSQAIQVISQSVDTDDLILRLSTLVSHKITNKSILFFDEIQEFPDILTWVKFLVEKTDFKIVLSGSLLGVGEHVKIRSLPVGFLQKRQMYPLRFEEFCWACGVLPQVWSTMKNSVINLEQIPDYIHSQLMNYFLKYLLIGGMPWAVQSFVDTGQLSPARKMQRSIYELYQDDMTKYVNSEIESRRIKMIYDAIPSQLCTPTKRFKYARLNKNLRFANMETAFDWLSASGIAIESTRVGEVSYPLALSEDRASLKLFYNDVGILTSRLLGNVDIEIINGNDSINYGSIYENVVAQELKAAGFDLHYYSSKSRGEIDFLVEQSVNGRTKLIEVKSGKDYKRHSALTNVLDRGEAEDAIVFSNSNVQTANKRIYLPVYAVSLISDFFC